jgi:hypothetical protein
MKRWFCDCLTRLNPQQQKMMPPGFAFHCSANIDKAALIGRGCHVKAYDGPRHSNSHVGDVGNHFAVSIYHSDVSQNVVGIVPVRSMR